MDEFRTLDAIRESIRSIGGNLGVFLKMSLVWTLINLVILLGYCLYAWKAWGGALDIAGALRVLDRSENFRLQLYLTAIPDTLGSLSVTILWTRFVIAGARPPLWLQVPAGSARYFGRSLIFVFGALIALIPGFFAARFLPASELGIAVPPAWQNAAPAGIVVLNVLLVCFVAARLWLVFPGHRDGRTARLCPIVQADAGHLVPASGRVHRVRDGLCRSRIPCRAGTRLSAQLRARRRRGGAGRSVFGATAFVRQRRGRRGVAALAYRARCRDPPGPKGAPQNEKGGRSRPDR
ncbi:MAG: hypothetical protein WDM81_03450 [Rhizomicrobium sp.]